MKAIIVLVPLLGLLIAGSFWVKQLREDAWKESRVSSTSSSLAVAEAADEESVREKMTEQVSEFDAKRDLRTLKRVPSTAAELEAAYRKHRNDNCEQLPDKQSLSFSQYTLALTPRDSHRTKQRSLPSTRRQFLTVGLMMMQSDEKSLPVLSRSIITGYLEDYYLSLQARIQKDPVDSHWTLHYRPIAAVGRYGNSPLTHPWVEALSATVNDICGLGLLASKDPLKSQTAVLLFRFTWLDPATSRSIYRHELGFLNVRFAEPKDPEADPFEIHLITTSDERRTWHYYAPRTVGVPSTRNACGLVGTVLFNDFMADGLQPKSAVTKKIVSSSNAIFTLDRIETFLAAERLQGEWRENVETILDAIVNGRLQ